MHFLQQSNSQAARPIPQEDTKGEPVQSANFCFLCKLLQKIWAEFGAF